MIRIILIALLALTLTNCSKTYKVKQEAKVDDGRLLNEVPQWYIDAEINKGVKCSEYESVVSIERQWPLYGIQRENEFGVACQMPDGRWYIQ